MSPVNYRLELPTQWSIHPVFHIDLLTQYRETITHGANYQRPPPDLVDNAEEYEVEKILDSRLFGRRWRLQYLVKWKGYPDSDNMWVDKCYDSFFLALLHADTLDCLLSPLPHPLIRASVLLRSNLADAIPSCCLPSCTIHI